MASRHWRAPSLLFLPLLASLLLFLLLWRREALPALFAAWATPTTRSHPRCAPTGWGADPIRTLAAAARRAPRPAPSPPHRWLPAPEHVGGHPFLADGAALLLLGALSSVAFAVARRVYPLPTASPSPSFRFAVFAMQKPQRRRPQRTISSSSAQVAALDIKIRQMELKDAGPCFYLGEKTFKTGNLYREWDEWEPVSALSANPEYCFVAELNGAKVVGFVLSSVVHKQSVSIGYIDWVVVDRAYQRLGIGTKLINKTLAIMREEEGITTIMADTPAENRGAIEFFMKHLAFTERIPHVYLTRTNEGRPPPATPRVEDGELVVRKLFVDDLFQIHQLGERVFNSHANLFRMWDENEVMDMFSQNSDYCLVATIRGHVAGFCLGTTVDKRRLKEPYGYLIWLAVDTAYGRRGIGSALMRSFEDLMAGQGVKQIFVDTQADNLPALKFFEAQAFGDQRLHVYMAKNLDDDPPLDQTVPVTSEL